MPPVQVAPVASRSKVIASIQNTHSSLKPSGADRLLGATVCSGEAAYWMIGAFLWFAFWGLKLALIVGFAVLRIRLK
jgi:hypothetical protein